MTNGKLKLSYGIADSGIQMLEIGGLQVDFGRRKRVAGEGESGFT